MGASPIGTGAAAREDPSMTRRILPLATLHVAVMALPAAIAIISHG
jgi:hypothetical protein